MKQPSNETTEAQAGGAAPANPLDEAPKSFSRFIALLSDGEAESEASYQLHELGKRLQELASMTHGKAKGKLKFHVSLVADPSGAVGISYNVETVAPKRPTTPAVFWLTKGGNLSPTDTRQLELKPRQVRDPSAGPAREV